MQQKPNKMVRRHSILLPGAVSILNSNHFIHTKAKRHVPLCGAAKLWLVAPVSSLTEYCVWCQLVAICAASS